MTPEYIVLGVILILMGIVQVWLRHGPGSKERGDEESDGPAADGESTLSAERPLSSAGRQGTHYGGRVRSGRAWDAWTAVLGGVGIAVGIGLLVTGLLGG